MNTLNSGIYNVAGKPGPGRPKGSVNKLGKEARAIIADAAAELGGQDRLVSWVKEDPANEKAFWVTIYPRIIPFYLNHGGQSDNPMTMLISEVTGTAIRPVEDAEE